jgi:hypothetical protein
MYSDKTNFKGDFYTAPKVHNLAALPRAFDASNRTTHHERMLLSCLFAGAGGSDGTHLLLRSGRLIMRLRDLTRLFRLHKDLWCKPINLPGQHKAQWRRPDRSQAAGLQLVGLSWSRMP